MISSDIINLYLSFHKDLIPLHLEHGKRPLHKHWNNKEYASERIYQYAADGYNLGWRLGKNDLVIDVDPRNNGLEGLEALKEDFDIDDLADIFPTVETGGKGFHYYARIPSKLQLKTIVDSYPGIEFKTKGGQVVIVGSIHPKTKNKYRFDELSPFEEAAPLLPNWLIKKISYKLVDDDPIIDIEESKENQSNADPEEIITNEELKQILDDLPIEDYHDNNDWFPILAAAHKSTNGEGLFVFLEWSLNDFAFMDHEHIIRNRWKSLNSKRTNSRGIGTLYRELTKRGITFEGRKVKPQFDFDVVEPETEEEKDNIRLKAALKLLTPQSKFREIKEIVEAVADYNPVQQFKVWKKISESTFLDISTIKRLDKKQTVEDISLIITKEVLKKHYKDGKTILLGPGSIYWTYNGKYWLPTISEIIHRNIIDIAETLRFRNKTKLGISTLLNQSEKLLKAEIALDKDLLRLELEPLPVINCQNGEIWIDGKTGKIDFKKHNPDHYLIHCIDANYDTDAECPIFDQSLKEIFSTEEDAKDLIRHLWEMIGYLIQPRKNLASWWLFFGTGANGKTLILKVLSALLGNSVLEQSLTELSLDRSNHAFANLPGKLVVIDEDVSSRTILPDSFLKKISENKTLTANPKFQKAFQFKAVATVILAANEYPVTRDLSDGMRRRANVIPFSKRFSVSERDIHLDKKIIDNELSGVLNKALRGLQQLRKRSSFKIPVACKKAKRSWLGASNPIVLFVNECCERKRALNAKVLIKDLFDAYQDWCLEKGVEKRWRLTQITFIKQIQQLGFIKGRSTKGIHIKNLKVTRKGDFDDE
jgi:putative DNA primase/helicase